MTLLPAGVKVHLAFGCTDMRSAIRPHLPAGLGFRQGQARQGLPQPYLLRPRYLKPTA
jgi:hypothetical protein